MRSWPHSGFSFAIRRISRRNSSGIGGRPGRDLHLQKSLNPARCQRTTVPGHTTTSAERHSNNRDNSAKLTRVAASIRLGLATAGSQADSQPGDLKKIAVREGPGFFGWRLSKAS